MTNGNGTEKSAEHKRGMQKKNGKERAAGEEKIQLHVYYVLGRAGPRRETDISWPSSPIGTVSCTACVLSRRTGEAEESKQRRMRSIGRSRSGTEENHTTSTLTVGNANTHHCMDSPLAFAL